MSAALTYDELKALSPCREDFARVSKLLGGKKGWNGNKIDAAKAREAGCTFNDIIWAATALARTDKDVERRIRLAIRLWMADCAARVMHIYEKTEASPAPRNAIIAARQFARGHIDDAAWAAARDAARDAAREAAWDAAWAAAWAAAWDAARDAAWAAARDAAWAAARAAARDAARAAREAAWDAEQAWQFDHLIARLIGDPDDVPLPDRIAVAA